MYKCIFKYLTFAQKNNNYYFSLTILADVVVYKIEEKVHYYDEVLEKNDLFLKNMKQRQHSGLRDAKSRYIFSCIIASKMDLAHYPTFIKRLPRVKYTLLKLYNIHFFRYYFVFGSFWLRYVHNERFNEYLCNAWVHSTLKNNTFQMRFPTH